MDNEERRELMQEFRKLEPTIEQARGRWMAFRGDVVVVYVRFKPFFGYGEHLQERCTSLYDLNRDGLASLKEDLVDGWLSQANT